MPAHLLRDCPMNQFTNPILCPICSSPIATVDALTTHFINAHSDVLEAARDKGVQCGGCGKRMPFDQFLPHVAGCTHQNVGRYFICPLCFKFCHKDSVLSHVKEAHREEFAPFERPTCQFCIQKVNRNEMASHLLNVCTFDVQASHIQCSFCQAVVHFNDLATHFQTAHSDEFNSALSRQQGVKCVRCRYYFPKSDFTKHVVSKCSGRMEQNCSVCPLCFKLLVDERIKHHLKSNHPEQLSVTDRLVRIVLNHD